MMGLEDFVQHREELIDKMISPNGRGHPRTSQRQIHVSRLKNQADI
jgi:hypothetical protein